MYIAANRIRIHVEEQGEGELALVFLHYWGGSSRTWRHVTASLCATYRTVASDHRGWGRSDAPLGGYDLETMADDALGVIEALDLKAYILVGHSMGGKVAQLLAARRPEGLVGLVLVAPSPPSAMRLPAEAREAMAKAYSTRETVEAALDQVLTARSLNRPERDQVVSDSLRGAPQAKAAWPRAASLEDISDRIGAIRAPTLVIAGELDRVDSVEVLKAELLSRLPHAALEVLPGVGHLSMLEAPAAVAALIDGFARGLRHSTRQPDIAASSTAGGARAPAP